MAVKPSPAFEPPRQEGISLRELSEALAQAMGNQPQPEDSRETVPPGEAAGEIPPAESVEGSETASPTALGPPDAEAIADDAGDPCRISPLSILEAMLFVGNRQSEPLTAKSAAGLMRGVEPGEIQDLVGQLNRRYDANGCPYHVVAEGPGYRLAIRPECSGLRDQLHGRMREARLSQAAIDVLAIVAYKQPIAVEQVSTLRGTPSSHVLAQLVRRRLLRVERPAERPRAALYHTTDRFLVLFGLESLADLPKTDDLDGR
jgi:segregation and condensation protein B